MNYKKLNQYLGWVVFFIATAVYFLTLESTVSLWDCGEYITTAYKLEVGHPPGAPLFMMIGRLFSFFAAEENVAVWINRLSALSSSFSILFMFWSITLLAKKMVLKNKKEMSNGEIIAVLGSGLVGSLAYTFSDSFWFSAVEGEVYAMASLFTAIIFWAILKWDEEMALVQNGTLTGDLSPNRWILLIMFLLGLAIGVHLLGILVVPAIGFVLYFRHKPIADVKGILITGIISIVVLGFIQEIIIPGSIAMASNFEVFFKNSFGLPFFSGTFFFFGLLVFLCLYLIKRARKKNQPILYNATMGLIVLLIGYGSFAMIVIRSNANTPLDENDPENLVTLKSYLKREQYGSAPIFFGPYWNSMEKGGIFERDGSWNASADPSDWGDRSPYYLRRFVVLKNDAVLKAFRSEEDAQKFAQKNGGYVEEKYFMSNEGHTENQVPTYSQTTFFPRMYYSDESSKIPGYIAWSGYDASEEAGTELGKDHNRLPTFGENMTYFIRYQINFMYWRYFMWNFAGRQNDFQGNGEQMRGNWASGINSIDNLRLGNQEEGAPYFTTENKGNNKFFFFPLILGLIGLFIQIYKSPKDAFVVFLAFFFTGIAIVIYLNQKVGEPRERDYAFAGSFYFFALWIGLGVYGLYEAFTTLKRKDYIQLLTIVGAILVLTLAIDAASSEISLPISFSWLFISIIGIALIVLMGGLKKIFKNEGQGALVATLFGLIIPILMGVQGWDDHNRHLKTSAHDLAKNYLMSCEKNGILFTGGDNDTFPLWYMQEVEGYKTDVRVCNLSLMQTDWYTDQMKMKAYDSEPLPIKFTEDQILMYAGYTDQNLFMSLTDLFQVSAGEKIIKEVINLRLKHNKEAAKNALNNFSAQIASIAPNITTEEPNLIQRLETLKSDLMTNTKATLTENIYAKYLSAMEIASAAQNQMLKIDQNTYSQLMTTLVDFEKSWDFGNIDDVMAFTRNDQNLVMYNPGQKVRFIPTRGMILPVDVNNAIKSGVISEKDRNNCQKEMRFNFEERYLAREQLMILDILANNDWKRGIYYSMPYGSEVGKALLQKGFIKQNGMVYELSPLNVNYIERCNQEKMYTNLMEKYEYGDVKNPNVLTDYYARRQTVQFRSNFATLAQELVRVADEAKEIKKRGLSNIKAYELAGRKDEADRMLKIYKNADNIIAVNKSKAIKLIKKSLEVIPIDVVLDYGEPRGTGKPYSETSSCEVISDGTLQEYVSILFAAGDKKLANELGIKVAKQLATIFKYYEVSEVEFSANPKNTEDLYASLDNAFTMLMVALDPEVGDPNGVLARTLKAQMDHLYQKVFLKISAELREKALDNGESFTGSTAGKYATMLATFNEYVETIGMHYGYLKNKEQNQNNSPVGGDQLNLEQLNNSQVPADSVLE
ncbi:MAG: DUF2723 domain-containing protein [Flavobacteriia bacterium]|nr:DUF2723 domain-containing protein [Flavobacteriia bacterium]